MIFHGVLTQSDVPKWSESGWGCSKKKWPSTGQSWTIDGSSSTVNWMKTVLSKRYYQ